MWGNRIKVIGWAFTGFVGHQIGDYCLDEGKKYCAQKLGMRDSASLNEKQLAEQDAGRAKDKSRRKP